LDPDEAVLAQCPEVLGNGRLRDSELILDDFGEASGGALTADEQFQNPAAHRIPENVKCMHGGLSGSQLCPV
jgi:hypothetical protein